MERGFPGYCGKSERSEDTETQTEVAPAGVDCDVDIDNSYDPVPVFLSGDDSSQTYGAAV